MFFKLTAVWNADDDPHDTWHDEASSHSFQPSSLTVYNLAISRDFLDTR